MSEFIYICYIGKDGKPSKPFLLPQEDPDKYDYQLYSYNIPELTKGAVEVSPYEIQQVAEKINRSRFGLNDRIYLYSRINKR